MIGQQEISSRYEARSRDDGIDGAVAIARPAPPAAGSADLLGRLWRYRAVRFGAVAASCTLGQLLMLAWLTRLGVGKITANGIGFALSAQANFVLSTLITWGDRKRRGWAARWAQFNTVAI